MDFFFFFFFFFFLFIERNVNVSLTYNNNKEKKIIGEKKFILSFLLLYENLTIFYNDLHVIFYF